MSAVLAIETSTAQASVALRTDGAAQEIIISGEQKQNEALLPAIDALLGAAHVARDQLGAIVIGGGPGSFTGLRIAAATAKGFCHALGIPLYAYSGLLAAAAEFGDRADHICALFDARRDEVYSATYALNAGLTVVRAPVVETIDEAIAAQIPGTLFVGDGALKHRTEITRSGGLVAEDERVVPRASALLALFDRFPADGRVADAAHWEPNYIRASGAERGIRG